MCGIPKEDQQSGSQFGIADHDSLWNSRLLYLENGTKYSNSYSGTLIELTARDTLCDIQAQTDKQTDKPTDKHTALLTDTQTDGQTDRGQKLGYTVAVSGPETWNSLPAELRLSTLSTATFARRLKAHLFVSTE